MTVIIPVVLAGGSGTRLWPMSSRQKPKQFHKIASDLTLFQQTIMRVRGEVGDFTFADPVIVANEQFADLITEQMDEIRVAAKAVILEPVGRNTAPAVVVAKLFAAQQTPDALLLFLPADHVLTDIKEFRATVAAGASVALQGRLVTFGITPRHPESGYGYILGGSGAGPGFVVDSFVEKPDLATAHQYLAHGSYCWNAGMFLFPIATVCYELGMHAPDIMEGAGRALGAAHRDVIKISLEPEAFAAVPAISVDYALMERVSGAVVADGCRLE